MSAIYHEDIADINLNSGSIHRSFMHESIGLGDVLANRFGVRLFRDGEAVNAEDSECIGFFMAPSGVNYIISNTTYPGSTGISGNKAYVQLPQDCYAVEGQFTLAVKLVGGSVTGTMRIIDGTVTNTGTERAVGPTSTVPSSAEIIAAYEDALALESGVVRHDIAQSLTSTQKETARTNIGSASQKGLATETDDRIHYTKYIPQILRINLLGKDSVQNHKYYENNNGTMRIVSSSAANTYIFPIPLRLTAGHTYNFGYLYNAFCIVCQKGTETVIRTLAGTATYTPDADCDLYVTVQNTYLSSAVVNEVFENNVFNTDKTLAVQDMPADAKAVGDGIVDIERVYYARDAAVSAESTDDIKTDITIDVTRPMYVTITNTSGSSGYFRAGIYIGDTWRYAGEQVIIEGGESYTWVLMSFQSNAELTHGWFQDNSFTGYTAKLSTKNVNQRTAKVTVFSMKKDEPLKDGNMIYVTPYGGDGALMNILDAVNYAKYKVDVLTDPVTIFVQAGVYTIENCSTRLAVINKGANKISIIGENPYTTIVKLVNSGTANNQMIDHGGDSVIQGLTFLNLHTGDTIAFNNNPYCLHNDRVYDVDYKYSTVVKDCIMYSEMGPPIGAGLMNNQKQVYENVTCVFNNNSSAFTEGALYVHSQAYEDAVPVGLEIIKCRLISQNGMRCLSLPSVHAGDYQNIPVTIRDCFGWTNGQVAYYATLPENTKLTPDSNIGEFETGKTFDYPITK